MELGSPQVSSFRSSIASVMLFEDTGVGITDHCVSAARSERIDKRGRPG